MTALLVIAAVLYLAWNAFAFITTRTILTCTFCNFVVAAIILWHK